jgi:uncharacterized protein YabE (DUF348 family)/3D (Asp-Asp-Asp) domain-containing protein
MKKLTISPRSIMITALAAAMLFGLFAIRQKDIILIVDGNRQEVSSRAVTVKGLLADLDVPFSSSDTVQPAGGSLIANGLIVEVAHTTEIIILDGAARLQVTSTSTIPRDWLETAGITAGISDRFIVDDQEVELTAKVSYAPEHQLLIHHPVTITLITDGDQQTFTSNAFTVGEALDKAGVNVLPEDRLSPTADTSIKTDLTITLLTSSQLTITVGEKTIQTRASADTIGEALAKVSLSLQGLDYSLPDEFEPLPSDGMIQVVRVSETIEVVNETIPFEYRFEASAEMDIDTQQMLQYGRVGQAASRTRTRIEDGVEVSQTVEAWQVVVEPVAQVEGYGTRITIQTLDSPDGPVEYYRALQFYATSYYPKMDSPPWYGAVACGGKWEAGFVAVDLDYVPCGTRLYVPGYGFGVAMDTSYVTGAWIDLGYPDDAYVIWSQYVTVYFLTPIPSTVPYIIPPDSLH